MIYNFYIFNRRGKCLYYMEWSRPRISLTDDPEEEQKLVYGMLFAVKEITLQMTLHGESRNVPNSSSHLKTLKTDSFVLHHFQSSSGIMFVVNSDLDSPDLQSHLQNIYSQVFVECVTRNPLYRYLPDESINCPLFDEKLREYVMTSMK